MKRSLSQIQPISTSHDVGAKRVLLKASESGCSLTQIAVTQLKAGEVAVAHIHPDMQEGFFVLEGEMELTLDGKKTLCRADDFVFVNAGIAHEMRAISDVKIMTIGCVIEAMREKLYPMLFENNMRSVIWGGNKILRWKQTNSLKMEDSSSVSSSVSSSQPPIGESWEVSAVEGQPSIVSNGTWAGYSLIDVIRRRPKEMLGRAVAEKYGGKLPLLAKFIDTDGDLSVQVHPNDEMAWREHKKMGKAEMWYVIDAKEGAYLYAGFKQKLTPEQYRQKVEDGTILEALAKHNVHAGDVFYLPSGRVHAIGSGILLAEIQQSSDVTYRIFDYNRLGLDGEPRELHTDLAAQALDFEVHKEYRTPTQESLYNASDSRGPHPTLVDPVLDTPFFSVRLIDAQQPKHRNLIKYDSFVILMCTKGECSIRVRATKTEVSLKEGQSCLMPAAIADYDILPVEQVSLLEAYIDGRKKSFFRNLVTGFRHFTKK